MMNAPFPPSLKQAYISLHRVAETEWEEEEKDERQARRREREVESEDEMKKGEDDGEESGGGEETQKKAYEERKKEGKGDTSWANVLECSSGCVSVGGLPPDASCKDVFESDWNAS